MLGRGGKTLLTRKVFDSSLDWLMGAVNVKRRKRGE